MSDPTPEAVLAEAEGGVRTITLNRPEARNAVNLAVAAGGALIHLPRRIPYHVAMELA